MSGGALPPAALEALSSPKRARTLPDGGALPATGPQADMLPPMLPGSMLMGADLEAQVPLDLFGPVGAAARPEPIAPIPAAAPLPPMAASPPPPPPPSVPELLPQPNFTGLWRLDPVRSDSLEEYLKAHGLPLIARQAAEKLELTQQIEQTEALFRITRRSKISCDVKELTFGHESAFKTARITVTKEPFAVLTTSVLPNDKGTLIDRRTMEEGGQTMHVVLDLRLNKDGGVKRVVTHRFFRRSAPGTPGAVGTVRRREPGQ